MDMVEKAARAICMAEGIPPDDTGPEIGTRAWEAWVETARAAIAVMREPTPEMVEAGWEEIMGFGAMRSNVEWTWGAMIDAALTPEP